MQELLDRFNQLKILGKFSFAADEQYTLGTVYFISHVFVYCHHLAVALLTIGNSHRQVAATICNTWIQIALRVARSPVLLCHFSYLSLKFRLFIHSRITIYQLNPHRMKRAMIVLHFFPNTFVSCIYFENEKKIQN